LVREPKVIMAKYISLKLRAGLGASVYTHLILYQWKKLMLLIDESVKK
jgi:hypothetical protein